MKLRKIFTAILSGLLLIGGAFAILAPNIVGWGTSITSINPANYQLMVQYGTSQSHITAEDFAKSISGVILGSGYIPRDTSALGSYYQYTPSTTITDDGSDYIIQSNGGSYIDVNNFNTIDVVADLGISIGGIPGVLLINNDGYKISNYNTTGFFGIYDGRGKGIEYDENYCSGSTNRALIDKGCISTTFGITTGMFSSVSSGALPYWNGTKYVDSKIFMHSGNIDINGGGLYSGVYDVNLGGTMVAIKNTATGQASVYATDNGAGEGLYGGSMGGVGMHAYTYSGTALYTNAAGTGLGLLVQGNFGTGVEIQQQYGLGMSLWSLDSTGLYVKGYPAIYSNGAVMISGNTQITGSLTDGGGNPYINNLFFSGLTLGYIPYWNTNKFSNTNIFTSGGNIGIGTTNPTSALHVYDDTSEVAVNIEGGADTVQKINFIGEYGVNSSIFADTDTGEFYVGSISSRPLIFTTNNAEKMRITSDGKVGIGTLTPQYPLDISGDVHTQSAYYGASFNGYYMLFLTGNSVTMLPNGSFTGQVAHATSGNREATLYRSGSVWNVANYLTP